MVSIKECGCGDDILSEGDFGGLFQWQYFKAGLEFGEFVEDKIGGDLRTVDRPVGPGVAQAPQVVRVDMGEYVDVLVEGIHLALPEIIDDDVGEIYFPHPASLYSVYYK